MTPELEREFESALDLVAAGINVRNSIRRAFRPLFERLAADAERLDALEAEWQRQIHGDALAWDAIHGVHMRATTLREEIDKARN